MCSRYSLKSSSDAASTQSEADKEQTSGFTLRGVSRSSAAAFEHWASVAFSMVIIQASASERIIRLRANQGNGGARGRDGKGRDSRNLALSSDNLEPTVAHCQ